MEPPAGMASGGVHAGSFLVMAGCLGAGGFVNSAVNYMTILTSNSRGRNLCFMLMKLCDVMSPSNEPVCDVTITSSFFPFFTKKAQFCTYFLQNATSLLREVAVMEAERYKSQENKKPYLFLHR